MRYFLNSFFVFVLQHVAPSSGGMCRKGPMSLKGKKAAVSLSCAQRSGGHMDEGEKMTVSQDYRGCN